MKHQSSIPVVAFTLLAWASVASAEESGTLTLTNAEVVSIDPHQRIMVIRNTDGQEQTVELDDGLAGFGDIAAGDQVVLSLRSAPGRDRVSSITKGGASDAAPGTTDATPQATETASEATEAAPGPSEAAPPPPAAAIPAEPSEASLRAYADRVAVMAQQANQVDNLWSRFRNVCDVAVDSQYAWAREWVSLWEGRARADLTNGTCRDLFNQVVAAGETVNAGMAAAEESARTADLAPGTVREVRRRYLLDWHGWGRTPPERLVQ